MQYLHVPCMMTYRSTMVCLSGFLYHAALQESPRCNMEERDARLGTRLRHTMWLRIRPNHRSNRHSTSLYQWTAIIFVENGINWLLLHCLLSISAVQCNHRDQNVSSTKPALRKSKHDATLSWYVPSVCRPFYLPHKGAKQGICNCFLYFGQRSLEKRTFLYVLTQI